MRCTAEEPRCPVPSQDANKWRCCCDETVDSDERHVCLDGAGFAYMIIYIYIYSEIFVILSYKMCKCNITVENICI